MINVVLRTDKGISDILSNKFTTVAKLKRYRLQRGIKKMNEYIWNIILNQYINCRYYKWTCNVWDYFDTYHSDIKIYIMQKKYFFTTTNEKTVFGCNISRTETLVLRGLTLVSSEESNCNLEKNYTSLRLLYNIPLSDIHFWHL